MTTLKNAVAAKKSVGKNEGYERNPELVDYILSKIPSSIINNYVRYEVRDLIDLVTGYF